MLNCKKCKMCEAVNIKNKHEILIVHMTFSRKIFSHYHFEKAHTPGIMAQKTQKNFHILIHVFCFVSGKTKMDIENK